MKKIFVTEPSLPPLAEFLPYLDGIWESKWLTNGGPYHQQFERELADYLGVEHLALFTNATIALVIALQALRISGEVITTPYSFVATTHALVWNGIKPVFVDIDPATYNSTRPGSRPPSRRTRRPFSRFMSTARRVTWKKSDALPTFMA